MRTWYSTILTNDRTVVRRVVRFGGTSTLSTFYNRCCISEKSANENLEWIDCVNYDWITIQYQRIQVQYRHWGCSIFDTIRFTECVYF